MTAALNRLRWPLVVLTALVLQASLVADLELLGARGDVMMLLAIAAGLVGGPQTGAYVGFGAGMAIDCLVQSPFGLSALAYCLTGYAVGTFQASVLRAAWWVPVVGAVAGSTLGILAFALGGAMLGQDHLLSPDLVAIMVVVALLNAVLVPAAVRVSRWASSPTTATPRLARVHP